MEVHDNDSGYVDNWQTGKTVTECNLHMLTTEDCSDVIFRVGSGKHVVRAHRYVLVSRSCVFHAMFCGPLAEKGEVTIPEIAPNVFKDFLRYIYTDNVEITAENVTGMLYTSRKYAVDGLLNHCVNFLEKSLSDENACQILEQCHDYGEVDLEERAFKILHEADEAVIRSQGFLDLCSNCFEKFLKSDELKLKEEEVFESAMSWATEHCKRESIAPTAENIRKVLGEMRYEIRFSCMPLDYLVKVVGPSGILTADERVLIMDRIVDPNVEITPFKSYPRNKPWPVQGATCHYIQRFSVVQQHHWTCKGRTDAISFSTNKSIELVGCQLYGPAYKTQSTYTVNINILCDDQDHVIAEAIPKCDMELKGLEHANDVMFADAFRLVAGRSYTISVKISGEGTNYGFCGQSVVETNDVEFTFKNSTQSTNGTTTERGQIPGLIWR